MARITVEDCLKKIPNRFELVVAASKRARELEVGADDPLVAWENDKPTVVALREIANGSIDLNTLIRREGERSQKTVFGTKHDIAAEIHEE